MSANIFARLGLADTQQDLIRNIVSIRVSQDLFDDLSMEPADWDTAIALELAVKPPLFQSMQPVLHRPFEEALWNDAIHYPFRHWMQSRFSDGSFGVWYGADSIETSVHETVHHWRHGLLQDAGFNEPGIRLERKIYRVHCAAALIDLRPARQRFPALVEPLDYGFTQQIGARLHREGHPGLISKSARCSGDVYALLTPKVLSEPRQVCFLSYVTSPAGVLVEREPGSVWLEI